MLCLNTDNYGAHVDANEVNVSIIIIRVECHVMVTAEICIFICHRILVMACTAVIWWSIVFMQAFNVVLVLNYAH